MSEMYENQLEQVTPALTDFVRIISSSGVSRKTLLSALAKAIIEDYEGTSLDEQLMSVKSAINGIYEDIGDLNQGSILEAQTRSQSDTALGNRITAIQSAIYIGSDGKCYANLQEG